MRPAANFTLHAILAAALAALATTAAAAGDQQNYFTITFQDGRAAGGKGEQIEIQSFHWGPRQSTSADGFIREKPHVAPGEAAKIESFTMKQKVKPATPTGGEWVADVERPRDPAKRPTGTSDLTMKRGTSSAKPEVKWEVMDYRAGDGGNAGTVGGSETMTIGGARTEGQATGKRQHKPLPVQGYYDSPAPSGSLRVKVKMPWLACEEGRKMPSLELADGQMVYQLQDVSVASCGGTAEGPEESVTFVYGKMVIK